MQDIDLKGYNNISVDVFLPEEVSGGSYPSRIILMAGNWWWIEMVNPVKLRRGRWTTVKARLKVNGFTAGFH